MTSQGRDSIASFDGMYYSARVRQLELEESVRVARLRLESVDALPPGTAGGAHGDSGRYGASGRYGDSGRCDDSERVSEAGGAGDLTRPRALSSQDAAVEGVLRRHSMRRGASMRYMPPNEHALFTAARNVPPDESS